MPRPEYPYKERLKFELAKGGHIVVAGGAHASFPTHLQHHPRIVFWDHESPEMRRATIPTNTRAVIVTRWINHATSDKLAADARKRHIPLFRQLETGEISRMLTDVLDEPHVNGNESPAPTNELIDWKDEAPSLVGFLRHKFPHPLETRLRGAQLPALAAEAKRNGVDTSERSLKSTFYYLRSKTRETADPMPAPSPLPPMPPPPITEPPPPLPANAAEQLSNARALLERINTTFDGVGEIAGVLEFLLRENAELQVYKQRFLAAQATFLEAVP